MNILCEVFGQGADWVEAVSQRMPHTHARYNGLLADIWSGGFLSKKEKLLVLLGICLGQGRSEMTRQIMRVISESASVKDSELLEIVSTVMLSRGPIAFLTAWKGGVLNGESETDVLSESDEAKTSREDILEYFRANMGEVPAWIRTLDEALPSGIEKYYGLRNQILNDGALPRKIKELTLTAVNAATLYEEGLRIHAMGFLNTGGSRGGLLEGLLLAFIGGGIVAWLEGIAVLDKAGLI
jgi:alkylhydroperoxidase/carboxymuconolactone decarboxylase family protein YurZ